MDVYTRLKTMKIPLNKIWEEVKWDTQEYTKKIIQEIRDHEDKNLEKLLRNNVLPPIKGEITKGKLKWRGLAIVHQNTGDETFKWLTQRGEFIGVISRIYNYVGFEK